jgi:tetratricopeptide (TPR) repeat protein
MHLQFARGWLELGDVQEAETELRQIRSEFLDGAEVLEVRFQVLARRQRYAEGLELALRQIAFFPNDFRGYMNRGNALFWLDRSVEAIDSVMQVLDAHPRVAALPYNLACYWMKLGSPEEAIRWLDSAIQIGQRKGVLQHALSDPDLRPIWDHIRRLEAEREEG